MFLGSFAYINIPKPKAPPPPSTPPPLIPGSPDSKTCLGLAEQEKPRGRRTLLSTDDSCFEFCLHHLTEDVVCCPLSYVILKLCAVPVRRVSKEPSFLFIKKDSLDRDAGVTKPRKLIPHGFNCKSSGNRMLFLCLLAVLSGELGFLVVVVLLDNSHTAISPFEMHSLKPILLLLLISLSSRLTIAHPSATNRQIMQPCPYGIGGHILRCRSDYLWGFLQPNRRVRMLADSEGQWQLQFLDRDRKPTSWHELENHKCYRLKNLCLPSRTMPVKAPNTLWLRCVDQWRGGTLTFKERRTRTGLQLTDSSGRTIPPTTRGSTNPWCNYREGHDGPSFTFPEGLDGTIRHSFSFVRRNGNPTIKLSYMRDEPNSSRDAKLVRSAVRKDVFSNGRPRDLAFRRGVEVKLHSFLQEPDLD
ncbi:hypothetical protein L249_6571, partial [Ophiocordyceps polyrhachis-furcata BCC 54312]